VYEGKLIIGFVEETLTNSFLFTPRFFIFGLFWCHKSQCL